MGKGDKRTKRGKRIIGTYGVHRPRTDKNAPVAPKAKAKPKKKAVAKKTATKKAEAPVTAKVETKKPVAKKTTAKGGDKLTKIEGIGPKVMEVLAEAGIATFADLAKTEATKIGEILVEANSRYKMFDPTTWPAQAELAAADKWDELKVLQDKLDGGKAK